MCLAYMWNISMPKKENLLSHIYQECEWTCEKIKSKPQYDIFNAQLINTVCAPQPLPSTLRLNFSTQGSGKDIVYSSLALETNHHALCHWTFGATWNRQLYNDTCWQLVQKSFTSYENQHSITMFMIID